MPKWVRLMRNAKVVKLLPCVMAKYWIPAVVSGLFLVLSGCGGSSSVSAGSATEGGTSLSQFQATLPDGSVMELEILSNDHLSWSGEYAVSAETGPYAYQDGTFDGTINGDSVTLDCDNDDGTAFTMTGLAEGDAGFRLTRSDIPGTILNFTPVTPLPVKALAQVSFNLNVTGTNGRCSLSDQPYSSSNGLTEYRGTWQGINVTFWSYSSGYANISIQVNDYAIDSLNYASYRLSDFSTVSKNSSSGYVNVYSPATKAILKFGAVGAVSP